MRKRDNVQLTYIYQNDRWVATKVKRLPSQHEISMSLMKKKLLPVKKKRQITNLPSALVGEEYDPESLFISNRLEQLRGEMFEMGLSNLNDWLERKVYNTQADALCAVRRRITSELKSLCNVERVSVEMDEFIDTIVNHVLLEFELSLSKDTNDLSVEEEGEDNDDDDDTTLIMDASSGLLLPPAYHDGVVSQDRYSLLRCIADYASRVSKQRITFQDRNGIDHHIQVGTDYRELSSQAALQLFDAIDYTTTKIAKESGERLSENKVEMFRTLRDDEDPRQDGFLSAADNTASYSYSQHVEVGSIINTQLISTSGRIEVAAFFAVKSGLERRQGDTRICLLGIKDREVCSRCIGRELVTEASSNASNLVRTFEEYIFTEEQARNGLALAGILIVEESLMEPFRNHTDTFIAFMEIYQDSELKVFLETVLADKIDSNVDISVAAVANKKMFTENRIVLSWMMSHMETSTFFSVPPSNLTVVLMPTDMI